MKDFLDLAKKRYSCRDFSKKALGAESIDRIIYAGLVSPSTCNYQPYHLYVVKGEKLASIQKLGKFTNAPVGIVLCTDINDTWVRKYDNQDFGVADLAILAEHMALEATDLGIDSIILGSYDPKDIKDIVGIPDNHYPHLMIMLGYALPEDTPPSPDRHSVLRKDPTMMVTYVKD